MEHHQTLRGFGGLSSVVYANPMFWGVQSGSAVESAAVPILAQ
jgi:hypothetical protein